MPLPTTPHPSSYRDPSGFIFEKDGITYRQINLVFSEQFDRFIASGCYHALVEKGLLLPHEEVPAFAGSSGEHYKTLRPEQVAFITYPYEWSFSMLKAAALLTLRIAKEALHKGMVLKDATPFNIQWHQGRFVFIDTLSFEKFEETPWIAYRQFCECFLGPLLLMHYTNRQLPGLMLAWPNGIPVDEISRLLPWKSRFSLYTYLHIHLHAKYANKGNPGRPAARFPKTKLLNLLNSLEALVNKLKVHPRHSTWSGYYEEAALRNDYLDQKKEIIKRWIGNLQNITHAVDLGANEGGFTRLLAEKNIRTVAADIDPYCIDTLYRQLATQPDRNIQPMVIDLAFPSPGIGVNNEERAAFLDRAAAPLVMALALIHHLAIGRNIPFDKCAEMFSRVADNLVIEFVPKDDEKIRFMLMQKKDIYGTYDEKHFVDAFEKKFTIVNREPIPGSGRALYLMKKK